MIDLPHVDRLFSRLYRKQHEKKEKRQDLPSTFVADKQLQGNRQNRDQNHIQNRITRAEPGSFQQGTEGDQKQEKEPGARNLQKRGGLFILKKATGQGTQHKRKQIGMTVLITGRNLHPLKQHRKRRKDIGKKKQKQQNPALSPLLLLLWRSCFSKQHEEGQEKDKNARTDSRRPVHDLRVVKGTGKQGGKHCKGIVKEAFLQNGFRNRHTAFLTSQKQQNAGHRTEKEAQQNLPLPLRIHRPVQHKPDQNKKQDNPSLIIIQIKGQGG